MLISYPLLQLSGPDQLENARRTTQAISEGWDSVWKQTIVNAPPAGSYWQVVWIASWVALIGSAIFLLNQSRQLFSTRGDISSILVSQGIVAFLIPVFVWIGGVNDHGSFSANFSYGLNRLILYSNEIVMQAQIGQTTLSNAIKDLRLTNGAADQLKRELKQCMDIKSTSTPPAPGPGGPQSAPSIESDPQLQCLQNFKDHIQTIRQDYENRHCGLAQTLCNGAGRLFNEVYQGVSSAIQRAKEEYEQQTSGKTNSEMLQFYQSNGPGSIIVSSIATTVGDHLIGGLISDHIKGVLYVWQFDFMNCMVGGLFLCGLSGPIAIASSLIPFSPRTVWVWLIGFFSFGLAIFYYGVLIGASAALIVVAKAQTWTELQFAFMLGLFAPAIATGLAGGGAWAAVRAAHQNGTAIASFGATAAITILSSALRFLPLLLK